MYAELLQGLHEDPREHLKVVFDEQHDEMVLVKMCRFPLCVSTICCRSMATCMLRTFRRVKWWG